ncbi:MAG: hypothetical protein WAU62_08760 [Dehalococcoidales bacterium]
MLVKVNWTIAPAPIRPTVPVVVSIVTTCPTTVALGVLPETAIEPMPLLVDSPLMAQVPVGIVQPLPKVTTIA